MAPLLSAVVKTAIENTLLLVSLAVAIGILERYVPQARNPRVRWIPYAIAVLLMGSLFSVVVDEGVGSFDFRAIVVLVAACMGGWRLGLPVLVVALAYRPELAYQTGKDLAQFVYLAAGIIGHQRWVSSRRTVLAALWGGALSGAAFLVALVVLSLEGHPDAASTMVVATPFMALAAGLALVVFFHNEHLNSVEERLEASLADRDRFLVALGQRVRTPATILFGASVALADPDVGSEPSGPGGLIEEVSAAGVELSDVASDVESFVRLTIGGLGVTNALVEVRALVERILSVHPRWRADVIGDASVWADPGLLRHSIRMLLDNAHRHGGDTVWVEIGTDDGHTRIAVCDDGDGHPDDAAVFAAMGVRPEDPDPHLGIGLWLAHRLIEACGGQLLYAHRPGRTEFTIELPSLEPTADTNQASHPPG